MWDKAVLEFLKILETLLTAYNSPLFKISFMRIFYIKNWLEALCGPLRHNFASLFAEEGSRFRVVLYIIH